MGCFSGPKEVQASGKERELASLAREKYQYSRGMLDPLQARERAEGVRLNSDAAKQTSVNRSVNAARESIPQVATNPNRASSLRLNDRATGTILAKAGAGGEDVATRTGAAKGVQNLSQGLQLSTSGSQGLRRAAATEAGVNAAKSEADSFVDAAKFNAIGNAVGTAGTVAAYKKGWFDPKPASAPTAPGGK